MSTRVCKCGSEMQREYVPVSTQTMERLDNGFMPRSVERLADAPRLYKEREKQHNEPKD